MMARTRKIWSLKTFPALIVWISSAIIFYIIIQTLRHNDNKAQITSINYNQLSESTTTLLMMKAKRIHLYDRMSRDLYEHGAAFLNIGANTSQSLALADLFSISNGVVTPILNPANPPVRANVLHLGKQFADPISKAVREMFLPYFDGVVWFQNTSIYHSSLFHASHHLTPVPATNSEIEAEANAIENVTKGLCPLQIVLDRVMLTSTGVLLGCWQVLSGTDPAVIREKLRNALPHAPEKQLYDSVLFHTSFARLLGSPKVPEEENKLELLQFFHDLVAQLNNRLHGFDVHSSICCLATMSELWFVEENDVLALALGGSMKIRKFPLGCSGN